MTSRTSSSRRPLRALRAALVALLSILLASVAASAARAAVEPPPQPIAAGTIEWGVKESFRTYVENGFARGSIATVAPARRTAGGTFEFPLVGGEFDPGVNGTVAGSAGEVRFSGHRGELDMRISDVRVELLPEGALLRADVQSVPQGETRSVDYRDVVLAELDLSAVEPQTAGGVTTWSGIPATLTVAGAPAFSGYYLAGAGLDPVTLSYEGDGGKPQPERFTPAGTPFYSRLEVTTPGGGQLFADPARGVVHKIGNDAVNAVDDETLETVGTPTTLDLVGDDQIKASAFDAGAGRIFAVHIDGRVTAFTWTGSGYSREVLPGTPGTSKLALAGGKLYFAAEADRANPLVTVVSGGPGAWTVRSDYPAVDTGGLGFSALAGLPDGRVVATVRASIVFAPPPARAVPQAALLLTDTGSELTAAQIAGTVLPSSPSMVNATLGYAAIEPGPDGSLLLSELVSGGAPRLQWLRFDGAGVTVDGAPFAVTRMEAYAVDPQNGRIVLALKGEDAVSNRIETLERDGTRFASVGGITTTALAAAGGDTLFAIAEEGDRPTVRLQLAGSSPAIAGQPRDAAVELPSATASATATFTAAAGATPAATVQWQRRPLGVTRWSDVPGATAETLTVDAVAAANGTRYRAVFENGGGRIATSVATLSARVAAPASRPPVEQPSTPGEQPRAPGGQPRAPGGQPRAPGGQPRTPGGQPKPPEAKRLPRGAIAGAKGTRRPAGRGGVVKIATIRCPRGAGAGAAACRVTVPQQVRVRVGRRVFRVEVLAPAKVAAGRSAAVRARLTRPLVRHLADGPARLSVKVTVRVGGATLARTVTVRVGAPAR